MVFINKIREHFLNTNVNRTEDCLRLKFAWILLSNSLIFELEY